MILRLTSDNKTNNLRLAMRGVRVVGRIQCSPSGYFTAFFGDTKLLKVDKDVVLSLDLTPAARAVLGGKRLDYPAFLHRGEQLELEDPTPFLSTIKDNKTKEELLGLEEGVFRVRVHTVGLD